MTLPTIPDYFKMYVDESVDLLQTPHIPCPFHKEKHGKSFSYNATKHIWRCFGECHCGGDVIDLHKLNKKFRTRDEAKLSLYALYHITEQQLTSFVREPVKANSKLVYRNRVYYNALRIAKSPDDWVALDYIMSKDPFDADELADFCRCRGYNINPEVNS